MNQILPTKQTGPLPDKQTIVAYHNTLTIWHVTFRDPMKSLYLTIPMQASSLLTKPHMSLTNLLLNCSDIKLN